MSSHPDHRMKSSSFLVFTKRPVISEKIGLCIHISPSDAENSTVTTKTAVVGGIELCNAFTELNDPIDQEQRFLDMSRNYDKDSGEDHPLDLDYLKAMSYGMPPNGGFGMGVDRLVMLLTDQSSIREVILFPHLRSK